MKTELKIYLKNNREKVFAIMLVLMGIFVRILDFGNVPGGFNQDEAFAGYEAFSLLNYGVDSAGYHNPCYFVSWGSGMNVLESYLAIPFMKLFGCSVITLRLPQLLCSCIALVVFYFLLKEMFSTKIALIGLGVLAISPWNIMLSRWGLESNLAPAFLLFGFYFLIKGIKNNKFWILSAIMYGVSLYSYSITWAVVPIFILLFGGYILYSKQKISIKYLIISFIILFIFALPLILFVLVNKGIIPEITTNFISIPKLLSMRDSEISINNLFSAQSYNNFLNVFLKQYDGLIWNSSLDFGLFYMLSIPFIIIGGVKAAVATFKNISAKKFCYESFIFFGAIASTIICLCISNLNVNKSNSLHFFTLTLLALGINEVFNIFKNHCVIKRAIICGYAILFVFFSSFYFGAYKEQISQPFNSGVEEAVEFAKSHNLSDVAVDSSIYYPQILFFDKTPTTVFLNTVEYTNYPSAFLQVKKFDKYTFGVDYNMIDSNKSYIFPKDKSNMFLSKGYKVQTFENFSVAYK